MTKTERKYLGPPMLMPQINNANLQAIYKASMDPALTPDHVFIFIRICHTCNMQPNYEHKLSGGRRVMLQPGEFCITTELVANKLGYTHRMTAYRLLEDFVTSGYLKEMPDKTKNGKHGYRVFNVTHLSAIVTKAATFPDNRNQRVMEGTVTKDGTRTNTPKSNSSEYSNNLPGLEPSRKAPRPRMEVVKSRDVDFDWWDMISPKPRIEPGCEDCPGYRHFDSWLGKFLSEEHARYINGNSDGYTIDGTTKLRLAELGSGLRQEYYRQLQRFFTMFHSNRKAGRDPFYNITSKAYTADGPLGKEFENEPDSSLLSTSLPAAEGDPDTSSLDSQITVKKEVRHD